jgi:hypothetical protein
VATKLQALYGSVDKIDAWVGILAEDHVNNSSVGPTAMAVLVDQFTRLRDGDRFWYQNVGFSSADLSVIEHTRLGNMLERNSDATGLQPNVFRVCIADYDHSGRVDSHDRDAYMAAYAAGSERADLDDNGVVDGDDLSEFLDALAAGCN